MFNVSTRMILPVAAFLLGLLVASNVGCSRHRPESKMFEPDVSPSVSFASHKVRGPAIRKLESDEDLSETIGQADGALIVDFYADWCGPCKRQSAELESLKDDLADSGTTVIKVNADHFPALKEKYEVAGLPTLLLIRDGVIADRSVGLTGEDRLKTWLN